MPEITYTKEEIEIINVKQLLTVKEAAVVLGLTTRSVFRIISKGDLRVCRFSRRTVRIHQKDLQRFIAANTRGAWANRREHNAGNDING